MAGDVLLDTSVVVAMIKREPAVTPLPEFTLASSINWSRRAGQFPRMICGLPPSPSSMTSPC
jgi:hypothetical protein